MVIKLSKILSNARNSQVVVPTLYCVKDEKDFKTHFQLCLHAVEQIVIYQNPFKAQPSEVKFLFAGNILNDLKLYKIQRIYHKSMWIRIMRPVMHTKLVIGTISMKGLLVLRIIFPRKRRWECERGANLHEENAESIYTDVSFNVFLTKLS